MVLLETKAVFFDNKDLNVLASVKEPWARLYLESKNEVDKVTDLDTYKTALNLIPQQPG